MATISLNGTYFAFTVSSANATVGATYTNNGNTFTVNKTIAAKTVLVCTGTLGATTSGTTLTKTSGTGDATITFSAVSLEVPINYMTYAAGDTLTMYNGQTLLINETPTVNPGPLNANTSAGQATIKLQNTSTTTPVVLTMNSYTHDITVNYFTNNFIVEGDWIQIATGTGAASQTIDFTSVLGGLVDWPCAIWVETGDSKHYSITPSSGGGQGYFAPFINLGLGTGTNVSPYYDVQAISMLNEFYGGDAIHGNVFQYNGTVATFGKGGSTASSLGGAVIPNGARVLFPNVHMTSTSFQQTASNRNVLSLSNGAGLNTNVFSISHNFYFNGSWYGCGDTTMTSCAIPGKAAWSQNQGTMTFRNCSFSPDSTAAASATQTMNINNPVGDIYLDYIWAILKSTGTYAPGININNGVSFKQMSNIFAIGSSTVSGMYPILIESILNQDEAPLVLGPWYCVGGNIYIRESDNIHLTEAWNSGDPTAISSTVSGNVISMIGCKNMTIAKIRALPNGSAARGYCFSADQACYQYAVKDIDYDGQSNTAAIASMGGQRGFVTNAYLANPRSSLTSFVNALRNQSRASNFTTNSIPTYYNLTPGNYLEWIMNNIGSYSSTCLYDADIFNPVWRNTSKTSASLSIGPISQDKNTDRINVVSGTEGVDWFTSSNGFYAYGAGVEVIITDTFPKRGILDFNSNSVAFTHTAFATGAAIEFSMRVNDGTDISSWTSWYDATTAANWQTALSSLTGYDSDKGFFIRLRLTTSTANTSRVFFYGNTTCTPDSSWTPAEIGFVPLLVSGHVADSCIALYDNTVPASPVLIKKQVLPTTSAVQFDFPYDFDATAKPFKFVLRKSGYGEAIVSDTTYQRGKTAPFLQTQYVSVDDATVSLYTGITVDGAGNTVTISEDHSINEIYGYVQWWAAQVGNMAYEIPCTTSNGTDYESPYSWIVDTGVTISGSGVLTLTGGATLTMSGTAQSTIDISHTSGTKAWTRISVGGLISGAQYRIYNDTDAVEIANATASGTSIEVQKEWTGDKNISITATYVNGLTAKLPFSSIGVFGETGASFTIDFEDDLVYIGNGIDGSTVTEFSPDYPSIQVDISDGDGTTTVQRLYAWFRYTVNSANGMRYFFNGIVADDQFNYRINPSIVDLLLDNQNTSPVILTGARLYRTDGTTIIYSGSNSIQIDPDKAYIADSDAVMDKLTLISGNVVKASKLIPASE